MIGATENNVIYGGNLFVACNDHFSTETGNNIFKLEDCAELSNKDGANISIPNTACSPGYSSVPDGGEIMTAPYSMPMDLRT